MLAGASFLAAGTIIVYAGAIIVTFLFVIMLAQMEGKAPYDRAARAPGPATFACFLLLWCLIYALSAVATNPVEATRSGPTICSRGTSTCPERESSRSASDIRKTGSRSAWSWSACCLRRVMIRNSKNQEKPNVAGLGESLYTTHLVTVGLAGVLVVCRPGRGGRDHEPEAAKRAGIDLTVGCAVRVFLLLHMNITSRLDSFLEKRLQWLPTDLFDLDVLRSYLLIGAALFALGMLGFLTRRNLIVMFLSVEMMLQGTALSLVAFGRYHGTWTGQVFTIVILTVAACEASIALALIVVLFNRRSSLDVTLWQDIREASVQGRSRAGDRSRGRADRSGAGPGVVPAPDARGRRACASGPAVDRAASLAVRRSFVWSRCVLLRVRLGSTWDQEQRGV